MSHFEVFSGADPPQVLTAGASPTHCQRAGIFSFISILSVRIYEHFVIQTTSLISMRMWSERVENICLAYA